MIINGVTQQEIDYSRYFNNDYNFTNNYNSQVKNIDVRCEGNILLEPRLQEYLTKRKHYKKINYKPCVPLDKEYMITSVDKKLLRSFLRGNKHVYETDQYNKFVGDKKKRLRFPSSDFEIDGRVPKIIKPGLGLEEPVNRGMFVPEKGGYYYEDPVVKRPDKPFDARDFNESKFNPRMDPKINPGFEKINKCATPYRIGSYDKYDSCYQGLDTKNTSHVYNKYPGPKDYTTGNGERQEPTNYVNYDLLNQYEKSKNDIKDSYVDIIKKQRSTRYKEVKDIDAGLESELIKGMPKYRTRNRSYGYREPEENYFDYLDEDFQNPDNTDLWVRGGESTRLDNKYAAKNRPYSREIY